MVHSSDFRIDSPDSRPARQPDADPARHWTRQLSEVRTRALKLRFDASGAKGFRDVLDEALALSAALLQELAGAYLQLERLAREKEDSGEEWDYLFERMPTPCVITDLNGTILNANSAAAALLNFRPHSLINRLLMHFVTERERFEQLLFSMRVDVGPTNASFTIRPRERAAIATAASVSARGPKESPTLLWFLTPESGARRS